MELSYMGRHCDSKNTWVIKWKLQYKVYDTALWATGQGGPRSVSSSSIGFVNDAILNLH